MLRPYVFPAPLKEGRIISRPNRFIMFVDAGGETMRCHCPTTGRLGDLKLEGLRCLYSLPTGATERKTAGTVEAIANTNAPGTWIGINQTAANKYFEFFLKSGALSRLGRGKITREVRLGKSRIDFLVGNTFIEVKTPLITLPRGPGAESVTRSRFDSFDRLIKHFGELRKSLTAGKKAAIVLCYQYDAPPFNPPSLNKTNRRILTAARKAESSGVRRWQVNMKIDKRGVSLTRYFPSKPYANLVK